jgi:hypothetical protein
VLERGTSQSRAHQGAILFYNNMKLVFRIYEDGSKMESGCTAPQIFYIHSIIHSRYMHDYENQPLVKTLINTLSWQNVILHLYEPGLHEGLVLLGKIALANTFPY